MSETGHCTNRRDFLKIGGALGTAIVYWAVLYWLIPMLLGVVWMDALNPLFRPDGSVNFAYAVLPPLVQAALMWIYTIHRWRTRFGTPAV